MKVDQTCPEIVERSAVTPFDLIRLYDKSKKAPIAGRFRLNYP
jgi:hypothetical protein